MTELSPFEEFLYQQFCYGESHRDLLAHYAEYSTQGLTMAEAIEVDIHMREIDGFRVRSRDRALKAYALVQRDLVPLLPQFLADAYPELTAEPEAIPEGPVKEPSKREDAKRKRAPKKATTQTTE